eukprot:scaffold32256_cov69-Phaeocystis_antarctica.AAC.5
MLGKVGARGSRLPELEQPVVAASEQLRVVWTPCHERKAARRSVKDGVRRSSARIRGAGLANTSGASRARPHHQVRHLRTPHVPHDDHVVLGGGGEQLSVVRELHVPDLVRVLLENVVRLAGYDVP